MSIHHQRSGYRLAFTSSFLTLILLLEPQVAKAWVTSQDGDIVCLALQADGKVVVGGLFTSLYGFARTNIARLNADGTVDPMFSPAVLGDSSPWGTVQCLAIQSDGKILVGGTFTNLAGQKRYNLGRLNTDGTPDPAFAPVADGAISSLALQPDGKILVGGSFTSLAGPRIPGLGRLNPNGKIDSSFRTSFSGGLLTVYCLAIDQQGRILAGGMFTGIGAQKRSNLARLEQDGSLDGLFQAGSVGSVRCIAVQSTGKIVVGSESPGVTNNSSLARFNEDGSLDSSFAPRSFGAVYSLALQADGQVLACGDGEFFPLQAGAAMTRVARLKTDGEVDASFVSIAFDTAWCLALQPNGSVLIGGGVRGADERSYKYLERMANPEPSIDNLFYDGNTINWFRDGALPDIWGAAFEYTTNGVDWIDLGPGSVAAGGWQLAGLALPGVQALRARVVTDFSSSLAGSEASVAPLTFEVQPTSHTGYAGTPASFEVWVSSASACSYQWTRDGTALPGATSRRLTLARMMPQDAGSYNVVVTNSTGSITSSAAELSVLAPPAILFQDTPFGVYSGRFGFYYSGASGKHIVIEATSDLNVWVPLQTNVLGTARRYFADVDPNHYLNRFYRLRLLDP